MKSRAWVRDPNGAVESWNGIDYLRDVVERPPVRMNWSAHSNSQNGETVHRSHRRTVKNDRR